MQALVLAKSKLKIGLQVKAKKIPNYFIAKGFPYVKIELEANVRPKDYDSESECGYCNGSGRVDCRNCDGSGITWRTCSTCSGSGKIENPDGQTHSCPDCDAGEREVSCPDCSGGYVDCLDCSGNGYFENDDWYESYHDDFWGMFSDKLGETLRLTEHAHIYYDGSVDTEVTMTLWVEYLEKLPEIVRVFAETCREFGGCDTANAGLHITLLPDRVYPGNAKLDNNKLSNFKKQVSKLLLGMVFLGAPDSFTRAFEFRDLEISRNVKYSAIYTRKDTCIEFRFFDACFDRPGYIIRYLELISRTLHYYADRPRRFIKLKDQITLKKSNLILNKAYRGCYKNFADVFRTDESVARLFREIGYLVEKRFRFWLGCIYTFYALGTITKQELFSRLVSELKV